MFRRGGGCWLLGICAAALGAGILIAAIFPVGAADVSGGVPADRVRLRLLPALERSAVTMRIVVWKSPKALSGILRKLFRIPE